jgi:hypothetical protein
LQRSAAGLPGSAISSVENLLWGAPRIHGELLKLGFAVAQSTVEIEFCRLLDRELAGFCPLQYLIDVNSRTVTDCVRIGSI